MTFYTTVYLPVCKQNAQVREMNMAEYSALQKHLLEGNDDNIAQCMVYIAQQCCTQDISSLCNIDLFCILSKIRTLSLGDELQFIFNEANVRCSLEDCIQRMHQLDFNCKKALNINGISIELNLPHTLNIKDYADVLEDVICKVADVSLHAMDKCTRDKMLASMPAVVVEQCIDYVKKGLAAMKDYWFIAPNEAIATPGIELNAFNNSLLEILKFIYKDDLMNVYNLKYILTSKLHITPLQADAMSPAECRIYVSLLNDEISKQNKQLQDQNNAAKYNL